MADQVYVIDVYSLVFQVFHAVAEMASPAGEPTNAVFGFTRDLLNILKDKGPSHWICAIDSSGAGERSMLYSEYKANRSEMPDALRPQVPMICETIEAFGIPLIQHAGWEADDVIATVVAQSASRDMEINIVSNDKDLRQLLGPRVRIYQVRKGTYYAEQELLADWGVRPDQVVDYQALVGDSVDNIPGVPLIGPKKASALLQQFSTLEGVLQNADQAPGAKLRENLKTFAEQARISRQLALLKHDLPLTVDWDAARVGRMDAPRLQELFRKFGFRRFGDELRALVGTPSTPSAAPPPPDSLTVESEFAAAAAVDSTSALSSIAIVPRAAQQSQQFVVVDSRAELERFVALLQQQRAFCLDLQTTGPDPMRAEIVGWAFAWEAGAGWYLPVQGPEDAARLTQEQVTAALKPLLERTDVEIIGHDLKVDAVLLQRLGITLAGLGLDAMVGDYLLDAGGRGHGLEDLARKYLQQELPPEADLLGKGLFKKTIAEVDIPEVAAYAVSRALATLEIAEMIRQELEREKLWDLYWTLERPLIAVLADMQWRGIRLDPAILVEQSRIAGERLIAVEQRVYALAGRQFNMDSPVQLRKVLFEELKLPVQKKTKTGASTDQEVLEKLALDHALPREMLEHRRVSKLKSTYLDALPGMVHPVTGRIHASFNQVVAATGRLSSHDPNLQNIPIRTDEGRQIRRAFTVSEPGLTLLCADYSQIELRMLAHFSQDPALMEAFAAGVDIHTSVAAQVYGLPHEAVDAEMRRVAKAVNFGVIYGQSPFGLAANLGIDKGAAAKFIDEYFGRFSGVDRYLQRILEECQRTGYATTLMGRRRAIAGIRNTTGRQRNLPERTAINTVIQGSAADLIKQAMINVHARLLREGHPGRILLQIHDELVLEGPTGNITALGRLVREEMEHALRLDVPLAVDLVAGENWLDVEALDV